MESSLARHPQLNKIIDLAIEGKSARWIAAAIDPPVSERMLQRYVRRVVIPAAMRKAQTDKTIIDTKIENATAGATEASGRAMEPARAAVIAHPTVQALETRLIDTAKMIATAVKKEDLGGFASAVNAEARLLDMQAKIAGLYGQAADSDRGTVPCTVIQVNISTAASSAAATVEPPAGQTIDCEVEPSG
jgi:hypothetical protein